ncbi:fungal hydrophobin [Trametes versicolor FP-101664 SS1]|uniref:fungal hydrophobin n=1 Tax=Trametes versicolor (strain FP-101664) TaxID=717944 RepID=UPI00046225C2|nr:fungal hydrophobin [Trametes versicolor FP-101664 SS1]EIW55691.1 fungal hydrophobin [Trametes versicolor FP-101664 SS1]
MFSRAVATLYFVLSLTLLAVALPGGKPPPPTTTITATGPPPTSTPGDLCSTGNVQCCQSVGGADDHVIGALLGLLGVVVDAVDVVLGLQCSPIKIVGLGTDKACSSNVVCCENNSIGGLISIGCIPIIL